MPVAERRKIQATISNVHVSNVDAFKTEDFGGVAEELTTEFDDSLSNRAEVPDFGLLESCHQLSKSIVEVLFLVPGKIFRGAEV